MSATLNLKYFNSFVLKKMKSVVSAGANLNEDNVPGGYNENTQEDWYIEESRIRGGYNNTSVDFGVKAYAVEEENKQQHRFNSIIYSGIFNSRTGINQTNVFSVAEDIIKSTDPANGSIQKLYAEDTNLIIFQEDKVSRALIDKDAIYSAEGNPITASTNLVIGQITPYVGNYGISNNPESFASYGYRKYFTDRRRNAVLRLSRDGLTEISSYGMTDFFRDKLNELESTDRIIGGWDIHNKNYIVSIQRDSSGEDVYKTLSFDEDVRGWTSFLTFKPDTVFSLNKSMYSTKNGRIYKHYTTDSSSSEFERARFYGVTYDSSVEFVFNNNQSLVKNFKTINYEGSKDWDMVHFKTSKDETLPISKAVDPSTQLVSLQDLENQLMRNNFKAKENKYFANLVNNSSSKPGEVFWGGSSSGVKGFFATVKMRVDNTLGGKKELFAVSTDYVESSY